jgi:hypothetical protein
MSCIAYPTKRWRKDADMHRLIGSGGGAIPAVIAACGLSSDPEHIGEYWWRCGDKAEYVATLELAQQKAEEPATAREKE